ncbi:MAG: ATP phosphoribosyltransferase [Lachnospiraceae bacterium]|nr:ATP phosphoribosyltransferase [Lachnospiraceae bacterium]
MNGLKMTNEEKLIYALRSLYEQNGYRRYKMSKFEEYDLYANNKDILESEGIITFTDTNGKLMALKPDVTLSVIRNTKDEKGVLNKVYYNESVYRISDTSKTYKEIQQTGLECIGDVQKSDLLEAVLLAAKSIQTIADEGKADGILSVSLPKIAEAFVKKAGLSEKARSKALDLIGKKDRNGLEELLGRAGCAREDEEKLLFISDLSGCAKDVLYELERAGTDEELLAPLKEIAGGFESSGLEKMLRFDLSLECGTRYYSGIVFKGYVNGIPSAVLSGGRYDALARRMGKDCGAVGFAVYMDLLERLEPAPGEGRDGGPSENENEASYLRVALPKGRLGEKVYRMFEKAGFECPEVLSDSRKLVFSNDEKRVKYFWVKPSDVSVYVERGAADIGVCGKDILMEYAPAVYELLDLKTGKCRMAVAAKKDFEDDTDRTLKVATKFEKTASDYYASIGRDIDVIRLNGSIELAPILGLSDVIVDIVETGNTLRENGLVEYETIAHISARLIANRAGYAFKKESVMKLMDGLSKQICD